MAEKLTLDTMTWIRGIRDRLNEETEGMTDDELIAFIHDRAAKVRREVSAQVPEPSTRNGGPAR